MSAEDFKRSYYLRTVCEVTREINDLVCANRYLFGEKLFSQITALLQEQMRMQKKMDAKLRLYKVAYETEIYAPNDNYLEKNERRANAA